MYFSRCIVPVPLDIESDVTFNLVMNFKYKCKANRFGRLKQEKRTDQTRLLIVIDLVMPNGNGFEVCRRLRQNFKTSHIPIVMISGVGDENQSKIKALENGATVFIDKPFAVEYLLQQTEAILKNQQLIKQDLTTLNIYRYLAIKLTTADQSLAPTPFLVRTRA